MLAYEEKNLAENSGATIIWLHGLGADGFDFMPIAQQLAFKLKDNRGLRFIFPHAPMRPVSCYQGYTMRAWFDIYGLTENAPQDRIGLNSSIEQINRLIDQEQQRGINYNKIILGGFSQGGMLALATALSSTSKFSQTNQQLGGLVILSACLLPNILNNFNNKNKLSIFMGHGLQDDIISYQWGKNSYNTLKNYSQFLITFKSYNMGHQVCEAEILEIKDFLRSILV